MASKAEYRKINDLSQNSSTYHKKDGTPVRAILKEKARKEIEYEQGAEAKDCPKCGTEMWWKNLKHNICPNCDGNHPADKAKLLKYNKLNAKLLKIEMLNDEVEDTRLRQEISSNLVELRFMLRKELFK